MSTVSHSIITPSCREIRGDWGAWAEAVARVTKQYEQIVAGWADSDEQPTLRLKLELERP